jgi:hypothetical protein
LGPASLVCLPDLIEKLLRPIGKVPGRMREGRSTLRPYSLSVRPGTVFLQRNLTPNQSPQPGRLSSFVKTWRSIKPVAVAQRQGRIAQSLGFRDKVFRLRSAFEKAKAGSGMKFEVHEAVQLDVTFGLVTLCQS